MIYQHFFKSLLVKIHIVLNIDIFKNACSKIIKIFQATYQKLGGEKRPFVRDIFFLIEKKRLRLKREVEFYMCLSCRDFGWTWSFISDYVQACLNQYGFKSDPQYDILQPRG